jgi:hypothetical protein
VEVVGEQVLETQRDADSSQAEDERGGEVEQVAKVVAE